MWESPIYRFLKPIEDKKGRVKNQPVVVDVTGSAPTMTEPGKQLESVFKEITQGRNASKTNILDFGAAKLRNTLYLLKQGFNVYAAEFPDVSKNSPQADDMLKEAETFPNFKKLIFPKDFYNFPGKFDIILMINVINVMPVPIERFYALALCREKMKYNGILLWYTMHGVITVNPKKYSMALNDGYVTGLGRTKLNFYIEFDKEEIHEMCTATGYSYNENFRFLTVGNNQAYVFNSDEPILLEQSLNTPHIRKGGDKHDPMRQIPELPKLPTLSLCIKELDTTKPGKEQQRKYHRLAARILAGVFSNQLKNPEIEQEINEGRGRIDISFQNRNREGFFKNLKEQHGIPCPYVLAECKNYTHDPKNQEYAQLVDRFDENRGMFGLLVCRAINNYKKAIQHCKDRVKGKRFIIVLCDNDLKELVKRKLFSMSDEDIDDYMAGKLRKLLF